MTMTALEMHKILTNKLNTLIRIKVRTKRANYHGMELKGWKLIDISKINITAAGAETFIFTLQHFNDLNKKRIYSLDDIIYLY